MLAPVAEKELARLGTPGRGIGVLCRDVGRISDKMRAVRIRDRRFRQGRETCSGGGACGEHGWVQGAEPE